MELSRPLLLLAAALWSGAALRVGLCLLQPSPPRVLRWSDPSPVDRGLHDQLVVDGDGAWLFAALQGPEGRVGTEVRYLDLAAGVVRLDWTLPPGRLVLEAVVPDAGDLLVVLAGDGLRAARLQRAGGVVDLGRLEGRGSPAAAVKVGDGLEVLTEGGRALAFRPNGAEDRGQVAPPPDVFRSGEVAAATWADGWQVGVWRRDGRSYSVLPLTPGAPAPAAPVDRVPFGAIGVSRLTGPELPLPTPPAPLPTGVRGGSHRALRVVGDHVERLPLWGGFWHWCMEAGPGVICLEHDPLEDTTGWTHSGGARSTSTVHPRWSPADPLLLPASSGGWWLLDHSHVALDGRIYLRLDEDLRRLDPLSPWERLRRVSPQTHDEVRALMATGGPRAVVWWSERVLPLGFLAVPVLLLGGVAVGLAAAVGRQAGAVAAGVYLVAGVLLGGWFWGLTGWM